MSVQRLQPEFSPRPRICPSSRLGLSLLEVLIACGVLALGLAGVAAMLPAAGQRFGAATLTDRARFVAANAHAEMLNRGWITATACAAGTRGVVFGPVSIAGAPGVVSVPSTDDVSRVFVSQDDIAFGQSSQPIQIRWPDGRGPRREGDRKVFHTGGPTNVFWDGGVGSRAYRKSLVWGATLVPASSPASPGGNAVLSIFVLRRQGETKLISLTRNADGTYQCAEADRIQRLASCSAVIVVADAAGSVTPTWGAVRASWPGGLALDSEAIDPAWQANSLGVIGFEGLVRVEHHLVTLR